MSRLWCPYTDGPMNILESLEQMVLESRPLADWERKDADEFFWSQFALDERLELVNES